MTHVLSERNIASARSKWAKHCIFRRAWAKNISRHPTTPHAGAVFLSHQPHPDPQARQNSPCSPPSAPTKRPSAASSETDDTKAGGSLPRNETADTSAPTKQPISGHFPPAKASQVSCTPHRAPAKASMVHQASNQGCCFTARRSDAHACCLRGGPDSAGQFDSKEMP